MLFNTKYFKYRGRKFEKSLKNCPFKTYLYFKLLKLLVTKSRLKETFTLCFHSN